MFPKITEPEQLVPLLEDLFQVSLSNWHVLDSACWGEYIAYGIHFDLPDGQQHTRQWVACAAARTGREAWDNPDHSRHWCYTNQEANFSIMLTTAGKQSTFGFATVISLHQQYTQQIMQAAEEARRQPDSREIEAIAFQRECAAALQRRLQRNQPEAVLMPAQYIERYSAGFSLTDAKRGLLGTKPVLFATLFYERADQPAQRQALLACFDRFDALFGAHLKGGYLSPGNFCAKTARGINAMRKKILEGNSVCFTRADVTDAFTAPEYSLSATTHPPFPGIDDCGMLACLEFTLPWRMAASAEISVYQEYLSFVCQRLPVRGGYGGLKLETSFHRETGHEAYRAALDFTGLEIDPCTSSEADNFRILSQEGSREHGPIFPYLKPNARVIFQGHIKSVNWYTLLGDVFVARLGGEDKLRQQLDREDIGIERQGQCLLIRAGDFPRLGTPEEGLIEPYAFVNKTLRPLRNPQHDAFHHYLVPVGGDDDAETARSKAEDAKRWLARFDLPADGPVQYWQPDSTGTLG